SQGGGYSHIMTPNLNACEWNNTGGGQYRTIVGASSNHPGGVNVGFLDGSIRFVKNSVSQQAWWGIATSAGGGVISASGLYPPTDSGADEKTVATSGAALYLRGQRPARRLVPEARDLHVPSLENPLPSERPDTFRAGTRRTGPGAA